MWVTRRRSGPGTTMVARLSPRGAHDSCTFTGDGSECNLWQGEHVIPDSPFTLVLSGGGLKGLAHIGVLRALEERGLVPNLVVGSSIGSLIGAAWAAGASVDQMEARALAGRRRGGFPGGRGGGGARRPVPPGPFPPG